MTYEQFVFVGHDGERLRADVRYHEDRQKKPVLLFLHGFKGFKDWGPFPMILERFASAGYVAVSINFSHNGVGEDLETFDELDRFARNTFTRELEEALDVIEALHAGQTIPVPEGELDTSRIGLIGHSRGGGIAILAGTEASHVGAVAAWAPVSTFERYTERQKEKWRREGTFSVMNMRTKQTMKLGVTLLDDLERNGERLDILRAARSLADQGKPLLVLTGAADLTAKPEEAEKIASAANGPMTFLSIIPQTGHTFGASHPYAGSTPALEAVMKQTIGFFDHYLPLKV